MNPTLSTELFYLASTAGLTGILWLGYILNRIIETGVTQTLSNPNPEAVPKAGWALRMIRAHRNAVENLTVFSALVIVVELAQLNTDVTSLSAMIFFYARLAHAIIYTMGVPVVRTLAFMVGFLCQAIMFLQIVI